MKQYKFPLGREFGSEIDTASYRDYAIVYRSPETLKLRFPFERGEKRETIVYRRMEVMSKRSGESKLVGIIIEGEMKRACSLEKRKEIENYMRTEFGDTNFFWQI